MENFRTPLLISPSKRKISHSDKILTIGSCFSDVIGEQLSSFKLVSSVNPFGAQYNPHSIHQVLEYACHNSPVSETSIQKRNDLFFHYDFHSDFSSLDSKVLQGQLKKKIDSAHLFLEEANWLIVTYGTAWVYERIDNHEIVSNCHKMPAQLFSKHLLTQKKILESFDKIYQDIKSLNPQISIILTVSPVRHLRDTLELNSVSKSVLRMVCHTITEQYADVDYFPSYEIMMDDLRDYRFYKSDMIHPSEEAEKYIWKKFIETYFDDALKNFIERWKEIQSALAHKPFQPASIDHQRFLEKTIKKLEELKTIVNVDEEIELFSRQLRKPHT